MKTDGSEGGVPRVEAALPERSDEALVQLVTAGDEAALRELYRRHADAIFRAAVLRLGDRQLAEEVLQDTYLALWNRAELFDPRQGSLLAWLSTIARNRSVDAFRRQGRRPQSVPLSALLPEGQSDSMPLEEALRPGALADGGGASVEPEQWLDGAWLRDEVTRALAGIPEQERQVIRLAYYEELTQSEIAARMQWPLGTVKTRTRRALARLRDSLASVAREGADGPR